MFEAGVRCTGFLKTSDSCNLFEIHGAIEVLQAGVEEGEALVLHHVGDGFFSWHLEGCLLCCMDV
jgi:hypothetical protein